MKYLDKFNENTKSANYERILTFVKKLSNEDLVELRNVINQINKNYFMH